MNGHIATLCLFVLSIQVSAQQDIDPTQPDPNPAPALDGYVYQWGDEFNYEGTPDAELWQFESGLKRGNEAQCYTDRSVNATVTGGRLLITGRKERFLNPNYDPSSSDWRKNTHYAEYTSASILGKNCRHFLYGHIEVRAKIDISNGAFPAIWTCGYNKDWPQNGEIDIMEYYKTGSNYVLTSNFCVGGDQTGKDGYWAQKWQSIFTNRDYYLAKDPDWFAKYHLYTMDWDENTIRLSVDGEVRNTVDIKTFLNWDGSVCFNNPQFMMLNLAIKDFGDGIADEIHFEVDYFRVYQQVKDEETPSMPTGLRLVRVTGTTATLAWDSSEDDTGMLRYDVYRNGESDGYFLGSTITTTYTVTGLKPNSSQYIVVKALDKVGNHSIPNQITVKTKNVTGIDRVDYEQGDTLEYEGRKYVVGHNLIQNPSFDEGFSGWYNGSGSAILDAANWEIHTDGGIGGNWLQGKGHGGKTDAASIGTAWEISPDSIYYFGFYASARGTLNDALKWQCVSATNTFGEETELLLGSNGMFGSVQAQGNDTTWCHNSFVYNNRLAGYKYLQCIFRWQQNGALGFDHFVLAPLREVNQEGTGICTVERDMREYDGTFYDLQGRKVAHPDKGIYLHKGNKVIIR